MTFGWHLYRKLKSPNSVYLTEPQVENISNENSKTSGEKVKIMWHFKSLSSCKGCAEAMANTTLEGDGKVRKTHINWPHTKTCTEISRSVSKALLWNFPIQRHSSSQSTELGLLVRETLQQHPGPSNSAQAKLWPRTPPELPQHHPGIKEAPGEPADWQIPSNKSLCFLQGGCGGCGTVLGFLREKSDSGLSIRNNSLSPEQNFSPLILLTNHAFFLLWLLKGSETSIFSLTSDCPTFSNSYFLLSSFFLNYFQL